MNVLDENILESQRQLLRSWGVSIRQIGVELGRKGMADEEILPFLLAIARPTLFTRDLGFAERRFCHARYCLVVLTVGQYEAAHFIRRILRHRSFNTHAKRVGAVIRSCRPVWPDGACAPKRRFDFPGLTDREIIRPSASVTTATAVKPGFLSSIRTA